MLKLLSRILRRPPSRLLDPQQLSAYSRRGRKRVRSHLFAPDPRLAVILTFGQSQLANEGEMEDAPFVPSTGVYNFNFFDGACYAARDPLLGTTCNRSNIATRLGDYLVRRGVYDRILLVPVAHGGTFVSEWVPNARMHPRLTTALHRIHSLGIEVTHALWQLGETDAAFGMEAEAWMAHFRAIISALRDLGMRAPVYVAQSTRCCGPPFEPIRAAQRAVVNPALGILPGPDTDAIGFEYRWDRCHFSSEGLSMAAELWFGALVMV
jgi:hypothetical protein